VALRGIWKTLGIEATTDTKAIKRAYAAILKTIDVEADPQAFMALRDAYDAANNHARYSQYDGYYDDDEDDTIEAESEFSIEPVETETDLGPASPEFPDVGSEQDDHYIHVPAMGDEPSVPIELERNGYHMISDMEDILYAEGLEGVQTTAEEAARLQSLMDEFIDWLEDRPVDMARDYEFSLAQVFSATIPRSDPVIARAIAYFGWDRNAGNWDQPHTVDAVVSRQSLNSIYGEFSDPSHRLHNGFLALTADQPQPWYKPGPTAQVRELLELTRNHYPALVGGYNRDRFDEWQMKIYGRKDVYEPGGNYQTEKTGWGGAKMGWFLAIIAIALFRFIGTVDDRTSDTSTVFNDANRAAYTTANIDIDNGLKNGFKDTLSSNILEAKQPGFYGELQTKWGSMKKAGLSLEAFQRIVTDDVIGRASMLASKADKATLREHWRLRAEGAKYLTSLSAQSCWAFFENGQPMNLVGPKTQVDIHANAAKILTTVGDTPRKQEKSLSIPGDVVARVLDKAKVTLPQLQQAFQRKGDDMVRCKVNIALAESLLAREDAEAINILRGL
jgi:hypothetical protein